jgi:hypothetical protein
MRLVPTVQACNPFMMLDETEMSLQLHDLAGETPQAGVKRPVRVARPVAQPPHFHDFLTELYAAAGMIMDRAECDALAKEMLEKHELVLAA